MLMQSKRANFKHSYRVRGLFSAFYDIDLVISYDLFFHSLFFLFFMFAYAKCLRYWFFPRR